MRDRLLVWLVAAAAVTTFAGLARAELAVAAKNGAIEALGYGGEYLPFEAELRIPHLGWNQNASQGEAQDLQVTTEDNTTTYRGRIFFAPGKSCLYEETVRQDESVAVVRYTLRAEQGMEAEGIFLFASVPISVFAGGRCALLVDGKPSNEAIMPPEKPAKRHFLTGTADGVRMTSADGKTEVTMLFERALPISVQDTREWHGTDYDPYVQLHAGSLEAGQTITLGMTLQVRLTPDRSGAHVTVNPEKALYRLDGFGGDYCFNIESPVTQLTLKDLNVHWARTEMSASAWQPENDNASPNETNWKALEANDRPGTKLRREFELARLIQDKGIPYVITVWDLPQWLYADQMEPRDAGGRQVPPEKWEELLECLGSYLVYAKRQYGVEPDYFSFNEPDEGVRVRLSAEGEREAVKSIGAHFQKLGLKTKMLLADVANARGTAPYAMPTLGDPEAMKYVGAIAFHSWGGATPEQYGEWGELARRFKLPLLVTELGVDANWRSAPLDTFQYALREVRMYQDLVRYACPQGTMQWEFTGDYSLANVERDAAGQVRVVPKKRYYFVKQFCNLTPAPAEVLQSSSDNDHVLVSAYRSANGAPAWTVQIANFGASRPAQIDGLPAAVTDMRAVRTSKTESFAEIGHVQVKGGSVTLTLEENSLLTLTTLNQ